MGRGECVRNKMIESFLFEHEMHVTWPPWMSPQQSQHLAHRSIIRNTIGHRYNRLEPKYTLVIASYHRTSIWLIPSIVLILNVVHTVAIRFPYINLSILYGRAGGGLDGAQAEKRLAFGIGADTGSSGNVLGVVSMIRTEDGSFGGSGRFRVIDGIYEKREAEGIR